jgi:hypothetical protein
MAIKSSGIISINDIVDEFGGTAPHSLNEYYSGGSYVPDTPKNANIPSSGEISFDDFYGASRIITLKGTFVGGGGAGGQGYANGGGTGTAGKGGKTGIMTQAVYTAILAGNGGVLPAVIDGSLFIEFVEGGEGGTNGTAGDVGTLGGFSTFGSGGAAGASWSAGGNAVWGIAWGAGGGGGGGDPAGGTDTSASFGPQPTDQSSDIIPIDVAGYYGGGGGSADGAGKGGAGGAAGQEKFVTLELEPGNYVLILGQAGARDTVGNFNGGLGCPGTMVFVLDSTSATYVFEPNAQLAGTDAQRLGKWVINMSLSRSGELTFS